ncbi:MAG: FAD-binding oxidoreductase [Acidimicrobiia bacterium]|nr:FAD-binding oxidoreductase [Acidimicrobiia bacterium]MDH5504304.1 FAD-binding oxidoreductase [Acidimicrobiia bacterium]
MQESYDVVIVGGALMGSSIAYFLSENPDFDGSILVVEPDPTYENAQSTRSGNSFREQFSNPLNIKISQFGLEFLTEFEERVVVDGDVPDLNFRGTGYLFLATSQEGMAQLHAEHLVQLAAGADVRMLTPDETQRQFPYMSTESLLGSRFGSKREGSIDGWALLLGFRRRARHNGVAYLADRVVGLDRVGDRITAVRLASGDVVSCGYVVNAAGTRAKLVADMAGLPLPIEPRSRTTFVFDCRQPIEENVPLTVTPEGVHFRRERQHYVTGGVPVDDRPVDYDDLAARHNEFEEIIWPVLATYVPQFERIAVMASWGGQYAYNVLDHNLVIGPASSLPNLMFANGFSGHGLQQSPAVGRGISELIAYGEYRSLDLTPLGYDRIVRNEPFIESAII